MNVVAAEKEIARILRDVETESGALVEAITLDSIEVTHINSERREMQMRVFVHLKRIPGRDWGVE